MVFGADEDTPYACHWLANVLLLHILIKNLHGVFFPCQCMLDQVVSTTIFRVDALQLSDNLILVFTLTKTLQFDNFVDTVCHAFVWLEVDLSRLLHNEIQAKVTCLREIDFFCWSINCANLHLRKIIDDLLGARSWNARQRHQWSLSSEVKAISILL